MMFKLENGSCTINDEERSDASCRHFHSALNRKASVDARVIQSIPKADDLHDKSGVTPMIELDYSSFRLTWCKDPGQNWVYPTAAKVIDYERRVKPLNCINS